MRSKASVRLPLRSRRPALLTELTTPRITEPAGTSTRSSWRRSTIVVASNRSSTCAVAELSAVCSRTSNSVPTGIVERRRRSRPADGPARGGSMAGAGGAASVGTDVAARACADVVDPIAQVEVLGARDRLVLSQLDLQVDRLVARRRRARPRAATPSDRVALRSCDDVAGRIVDVVLRAAGCPRWSRSGRCRRRATGRATPRQRAASRTTIDAAGLRRIWTIFTETSRCATAQRQGISRSIQLMRVRSL